MKHDSRESWIVPWIYRAMAAFVCGILAGALGIPSLHFVIYGAMDPFLHRWPICLQGTAFVVAFLISLAFRGTLASAVGIYTGLVGVMLASEPEYPAPAAIGLAIHGFGPAVMGAVLSLAVLRLIPSKSGKLPALSNNGA